MSALRSDFADSASANVTWQVLGNTVVMGPLNTPDVESAVQDQGLLAQTLLNVSAAGCRPNAIADIVLSQQCLHSPGCGFGLGFVGLQQLLRQVGWHSLSSTVFIGHLNRSPNAVSAEQIQGLLAQTLLNVGAAKSQPGNCFEQSRLAVLALHTLVLLTVGLHVGWPSLCKGSGSLPPFIVGSCRSGMWPACSCC
jgi:hypothetical protein